MKEDIVRITRIVLTNFKNVANGIAEMPSAVDKDIFAEKADILGIYGQNGSGKTSVVEALRFVQLLLSGRSLPEDAGEYIAQGEPFCEIEIQFAVTEGTSRESTAYYVKLRREEDGVTVFRERLSVTPRVEGKRAAESVLVDYCCENQNVTFSPEYRFKKLVAMDKKQRIALNVAQAMSVKSRQSFIFGEDGYRIFSQCGSEVMGGYEDIFQILRRYALLDLFVINNVHSSAIGMNLLLPVAFHLKSGERITAGDLVIRIDEPSVISKDRFQLAETVIESMNIVLDKVIPGIRVRIHNFGEQLLNDGSIGYRIELLSERGERSIPLKYESEGIVKIISFLNVLICVYNDPSMCLVIDELDSGVFEYLLGEMLTVFADGGKGQLIFTSHNLRALEMLGKKSILFSTTNPNNRYIRLQNVQTNNNLRDVYLRCLTIGGQKEEMYEETDRVAIGRAFRRAGRAVGHAEG